MGAPGFQAGQPIEPFRLLVYDSSRRRTNPAKNPEKISVRESGMKISLFGTDRDRMPRLAFRIMKLMFDIRDRLVSVGPLLDRFGIKRGQTVVDYGCGPGSYLKHASELVGPEGRVVAVDIHELAVEAVNKRSAREGWTNVTALLTDGRKTPVPDETADIIYALDMFHMVASPEMVLRELNRICKKDGVLFIDNGHQSRQEAKRKIISSGVWDILEEPKRYMKCRPIKLNQPGANGKNRAGG